MAVLHRRLLVTVCALPLALLCSCGNRCGDLPRVGDRCVVPGGADDAAYSDADPAADAGGDATGADGQIRGLGALCSEPAHCAMDADYCAMQPGASSGYCSISGCRAGDPRSCPAGYYCFDLSVFGAGLPTFCARR